MRLRHALIRICWSAIRYRGFQQRV